MNILIHSKALQSGSDSLLWPGALYGIKKLTELGHSVSYKESELSESQLLLLKNEKITPSSFSAESADLTVKTDGNLLKLFERNESVDTAENWIQLSEAICFPKRSVNLQRDTAETKISLVLNLDGSGKADIQTGLPFFDHMLDQIARHGLIDLKLECTGDLEVDEHHTIEDTAIALGEAVTKALGNKTGIRRYSFVLPMDESQSRIALDLSGRPYLEFEGSFSREKVGGFPTEMVKHFFYSLAMHAKATLHIKVEGENDHHKIEACFKGFARCLRASITRSERNLNILPSTKELL